MRVSFLFAIDIDWGDTCWLNNWTFLQFADFQMHITHRHTGPMKENPLKFFISVLGGKTLFTHLINTYSSRLRNHLQFTPSKANHVTPSKSLWEYKTSLKSSVSGLKRRISRDKPFSSCFQTKPSKVFFSKRKKLLHR